MKRTILVAALLASVSLLPAYGAEICWPSHGNWQNAAPQSCKLDERRGQVKVKKEEADEVTEEEPVEEESVE